jgi:hypothetical protein
MRRKALLTLWVCASLGTAAVQGGSPGAARIEDLSWLAGSWSGEVRGAAPGTRFETHYTTPQGGLILSISKAFSPEGTLRWFELERFEARDGVLQVTPHPNGRASVSFPLVDYDAATKKAVFANAQHDYPNRLTYQRIAEDRLLIILTGDDPGEPVMEFALSRLP